MHGTQICKLCKPNYIYIYIYLSIICFSYNNCIFLQILIAFPNWDKYAPVIEYVALRCNEEIYCFGLITVYPKAFLRSSVWRARRDRPWRTSFHATNATGGGRHARNKYVTGCIWEGTVIYETCRRHPVKQLVNAPPKRDWDAGWIRRLRRGRDGDKQ